MLKSTVTSITIGWIDARGDIRSLFNMMIHTVLFRVSPLWVKWGGYGELIEDKFFAEVAHVCVC